MAWLRPYAGAGQPLVPRVARMLAVAAMTKPVLKEGYASTAEVCARMTQRLGLPPASQDAALGIFEM